MRRQFTREMIPFDVPGVVVEFDKLPIKLNARLISLGLYEDSKFSYTPFCTQVDDIYYIVVYKYARVRERRFDSPRQHIYCLLLWYVNPEDGLWFFSPEREAPGKDFLIH